MSAAANRRDQKPARICAWVSDASAGAPGIRISGVSKTYRSARRRRAVAAAAGFSISTRASSLSWSGPSGCGKSTLLKMISGLLAPSSGEILVEGEQVTKPHGNVGIVFQNALLLPWRNIIGNVMLPIDMKKTVARKISAARDGIIEDGRSRRF